MTTTASVGPMVRTALVKSSVENDALPASAKQVERFLRRTPIPEPNSNAEHVNPVGLAPLNGENPTPFKKAFAIHMGNNPTKTQPVQTDQSKISQIRRLEFQAAFALIQQCAHEINRMNGWWEKREKVLTILHENGIDYSPNVAVELFGLAKTEISEAIEAARKHKPDTWGDAETKDTMVREVAGCIVRLMDLAEFFNLPVADAILKELDHNTTRGKLHGGKAA